MNVAPPALAQGVPPRAVVAAIPPKNLGNIKAAFVYPLADYATGGTGLRNRGAAAVHVSGLTQPVQAALLYWAVITMGAPPVADTQVQIRRRFPTASGSATLTGVVVGTGPSPCWPGNTITVWRAAVPLGIANGNGTFEVSYGAGASGLTTGTVASPLDPLPYMEGASLVLISHGAGTVSVYDRGIAGQTFGLSAANTLTYALRLPTPTLQRTLWDNIGADGQISVQSNRLADAAIAADTTTINGTLIAGPGSATNDGDWNGAIAGPLPQLWDTTGHDVSGTAPAGTTALTVTFAPTLDCLTPVANVVGEY